MSEPSRSKTGGVLAGLSLLLPLGLMFVAYRLLLQYDFVRYDTSLPASLTLRATLVAASVTLLLAGIWISRELFAFVAAWPPVATAVIVVVCWVWMRGFHLQVEGWSVSLFDCPPLVVGMVSGTLLALAATIAAWRQGRRASILLLLAWDLVAAAVFLIPFFGFIFAWAVGGPPGCDPGPCT